MSEPSKWAMDRAKEALGGVECICIAAYTNRGRTDPHCELCNNQEDVADALDAARAEGRREALEDVTTAMKPMLRDMISRGEAVRIVRALLDKEPSR